MMSVCLNIDYYSDHSQNISETILVIYTDNIGLLTWLMGLLCSSDYITET